MSSFFDENTISFVDIETNGMSIIDGQIIEIAIIQMRSHEIVTEYQTLINHHEDYLPWYIERMTGITVDMLQGKPSFREISDSIYEMLDNTIFVAHNVSFDYNFIKSKLNRQMLEIDLDRICTVKLSRKLNTGFKSHKLDSLIDHLGIEVENRHRAMGDVEVLVKYYNYLLEMHGEEELEKILKSQMQKKKVVKN